MARGVIGSDIYGYDLVDQAIVYDTLNKKIDNMRIGTYTFPNNPARCQYTCDRSVIRHKYPELRATELEDLDPDAAILSGSGEFFGLGAYDEWNKLNRIFQEHGMKDFYHPIFTDITLAVIKKLEAAIEPRENYVAYTFEIWQHLPPVITSTSPINNGILVNASISTSSQIPTLSIGDSGEWVVKLQKALIANDNNSLPKYGVDGRFGSETEKAVRAYQSEHSLTIDGIAGTETLGHMSLSDYDGSADKSIPDSIYIVKSGDTLTKIANKYNTTWQNLADINALNNPHSISVGQRLKVI